MFKIIVVSFFTLFSSLSFSYSQLVEGEIGIFRSAYVEDTSSYSNASWIGLKGLSSADSCPVEEGYVRLKISEKSTKLYSSLLAAAMAGKKVRVRVDDSKKDDLGNCLVWYADVIY
jgi:hypothetical protein